MADSTIRTIKKITENKFKEKGSLFIGQAFPVASQEDADELLLAVKKKFYDATHNCYAYTVFENVKKYSDDGEPGGTAGIRLMNAIDHFQLENVLLISTRYFGGTKLGVGPLGKAYYKSGFDTLTEAEIIETGIFNRLQLTFGFDLISPVHHHLGRFNAVILDSGYDRKYILSCLIPENRTKDFLGLIQEIFYEKVEISVSEKKILHNL